MTHLVSGQLALQLLAESDLPNLLRVYQATPDFFTGSGGAPALPSLDDVRQQWQTAQLGSNRYLFGIYQQQTGQLIGAADVQIGVPQPETAALWILIEGSWQHQGYGQECIALLEHWLIAEQGVESLCAIASSSAACLRFLEFQGFRATDTDTIAPIAGMPAHWMCW